MARGMKSGWGLSASTTVENDNSEGSHGSVPMRLRLITESGSSDDWILDKIRHAVLVKTPYVWQIGK